MMEGVDLLSLIFCNLQVSSKFDFDSLPGSFYYVMDSLILPVLFNRY